MTAVKTEVSAVRRVRTKKMPSVEALDIDAIRAYAPARAGGRIIAVWHKHKVLEKTVKDSLDTESGIDTEVVGESPTRIIIEEVDGGRRTIECATIEDELNFLFGVLPTIYRPAQLPDQITHFVPESIRFEVVKDDALWETIPPHQRREREPLKKGEPIRERMVEVPAEYDGLMAGDTVLAIMGGSGGPYTQALMRRASVIGAKVLHVPPVRVHNYRTAKYGGVELTEEGELTFARDVRSMSKKLRKLGSAAGEAEKMDFAAMEGKLAEMTRHGAAHRDKDAEHLIELFRTHPSVFRPVYTFHAAFTHAGECFRAFLKAQEARKQKQLSMIALAKSALYTHPEGIYPKGGIVSYTEAYMEKSEAFTALRTAEKEAKKELERALMDPRVSRLEEMLRSEFGFLGPRIFGVICACVGTFARFKTKWAFNKYVGTHVNMDGTFVRRGRGLGSDMFRQEIWLMVPMIIKRPDLPWRTKYDMHKANVRAQHPEKVIQENGKSRWSDIHVHKTAMWKTATDIALTIYEIGKEWEREMRALEKGTAHRHDAEAA